MKKIMTVLAAIMVVVAFVGNAVAKTAPARVRVDASGVTGLAAGASETATRAEDGVADLRALLSETRADLVKAQRDIRVAKGIGGSALARAKQVETTLATKVAELEAKISSETIKAQAEVDKAAVNATVRIVGIQHGVPAPAPAPDAVAAATAPTPLASATGLERVACLAGTTYRRISVTDGALRTGYREECLPIPGYASPDAPKAGHSTGDYLVACGIGAGSTALVALAIPGISNFSSEVEVSGADYGIAAAAGAGVGCLGGILFTALSD